MKVSAYKISKAGEAQTLDPKTCVEQRLHEDGACWIDIAAFKPDELSEWLKPLDLSPLAMKCCRDAGSSTRVVPMGDELFCEFSALVDDTKLGRTAVSILCVGNLVLTLHQDPPENLLSKLAELRELRLEPTAGALVALLLMGQSSRLGRAVQTVIAGVATIDDRLDHEPDEVSTEEILDQKDALRILDSVSSEQATCFPLLVEVGSKALGWASLGALPRMIAASAQHNRRTVDRLEKHLADVWQRFDMHQQDKTNSRLATLTVISAIFLPLTLFAGIWGMNFAVMPELQWPHGYLFALGSMAVVAGGMTWVFYKRGWFD
jgi:Mg2+ and Co2+ transporter CorA